MSNITKQSKAPAIDGAIKILDLLAKSPCSLTLSEIAEETGLPNSSTHRLIDALLDKQMISIDPSRNRRYCMGAHIFRLASMVLSRQDSIPIFHPIAEILKNETYHSVYLNVEVGSRIVVIAKTESSMAKVSKIYIGSTQTMYEASAGKAILSMRSAEYQRQYLESVLPKRADGRNGLEGLLEELQHANRLGYATTASEKMGELCFISAPVFTSSNEPTAAISLGVPMVQFSPRTIKNLSGHLIQATRHLSSRLE